METNLTILTDLSTLLMKHSSISAKLCGWNFWNKIVQIWKMSSLKVCSHVLSPNYPSSYLCLSSELSWSPAASVVINASLVTSFSSFPILPQVWRYEYSSVEFEQEHSVRVWLSIGKLYVIRDNCLSSLKETHLDLVHTIC